MNFDKKTVISECALHVSVQYCINQLKIKTTFLSTNTCFFK